MIKRALLIVVIVCAVAALVAYLADSRNAGRPEAAVKPVEAAPAIKMTGGYADDWQRSCAPLNGNAQSECTMRLDGLYGRSSGAAVPPAK